MRKTGTIPVIGLITPQKKIVGILLDRSRSRDAVKINIIGRRNPYWACNRVRGWLT